MEKQMEILNYLIYKNQELKKEEISNINKLKKMYDEIRRYIDIPCTYEQIITDSYIRMCFFKDVISTAFENKNISYDTKDEIFEMYEKIYHYLCKDSNLEEIEIPEKIIQKLFERKYVPKESELSMIITLLKENKRIYETEIKDKYLSQTLQVGFHKGIIKDLKIEEQNIPHLLGLTNDGSLYEFYRKIMLQKEITRILNLLGAKNIDDPNLDHLEFNKIFKEEFGLDYSKENCIKIISWRYNADKKYLDKRNIKVTEEERKILNSINDYAPKAKTLDFYCMPETLKLLEEENNKVKEFIYKYIKKVKNDNSVSTNISEYIEKTQHKLEEDENFKISFINTFGYSYPLINYYELLSKNISFYNFSLFKNLNSIIVDYDSHGKQIKSDVFLVSYNQNKMNNIKETILKLIKEKDKKYEEAIAGDITDTSLSRDYIMRAKSLSNFPEDKRYYFEYGFLSHTRQQQNDDIMKVNSPKTNNITLIGFKASEKEKDRLKDLEKSKRRRVKHFLNCETNITSNYYEYETDFTRSGIEYPIELIEERGDLPRNNKKYKVLKMQKPLDRLSRCIKTFELCIYNNEDERILEKLKQEIFQTIDEYEQMTMMKIAIMEYRMERRNTNIQGFYQRMIDYEKDISESRNMLGVLFQYKEYVNNMISNEYISNKNKRR